METQDSIGNFGSGGESQSAIEVIVLNSGDFCFLCDKPHIIALLETQELFNCWQLRELFKVLNLNEAELMVRLARNCMEVKNGEREDELLETGVNFEATLCDGCGEVLRRLLEAGTEGEVKLALVKFARVLEGRGRCKENQTKVPEMCGKITEALREELKQKCKSLLRDMPQKENVNVVQVPRSKSKAAVRVKSVTPAPVKEVKVKLPLPRNLKPDPQQVFRKVTRDANMAAMWKPNEEEDDEEEDKAEIPGTSRGGKRRAFPCPYCDTICSDSSKVRIHCVQLHTHEDFLACKPPEMSSEEFRGFCKKHLKNLTKECEEVEEKGSKKRKCAYPECKAAFAKNSYLVRHLVDNHQVQVVSSLRKDLRKQLQRDLNGGPEVATKEKKPVVRFPLPEKKKAVASSPINSEDSEQEQDSGQVEKPKPAPSKKHGNDKKAKCHHCPVVLSRLEHLRVHMVREHPDQVFLTKKPASMSLEHFKSLMYQLFRDVKGEMTVKRGEWKCTHCKDTYKKEWYLIRHLCEVHCKEMTKRLKQVQVLGNFEEDQGEDDLFTEVKGLNKEMTRCPHCRKILGGQYKVDIHICQHHPEQIFLEKKPDSMEMEEFSELVKQVLDEMGSACENLGEGEVKIVKCCFCENTYKEVAYLRGHFVGCHGNKVKRKVAKAVLCVAG